MLLLALLLTLTLRPACADPLDVTPAAQVAYLAPATHHANLRALRTTLLLAALADAGTTICGVRGGRAELNPVMRPLSHNALLLVAAEVGVTLLFERRVRGRRDEAAWLRAATMAHGAAVLSNEVGR